MFVGIWVQNLLKTLHLLKPTPVHLLHSTLLANLNIEKEKYYFYQKYNKTENANKLIKYINKIIAEDKTIGSSKEFSQGIEFLNAVYYLDNEKYKEALTSIKKAEEFAYCDCQKREIYELKYSIYNALGNKAKAKKYKKLAKIED